MPTLQQFPSEIPQEETTLGNLAKGARPIVDELMKLRTASKLQEFSTDPLAKTIFEQTGGDIAKTTKILGERSKTRQLPPPDVTPEAVSKYVRDLEKQRLGRDLSAEEIKNINEKVNDPEKLKKFQDFAIKEYEKSLPQTKLTFEQRKQLKEIDRKIKEEARTSKQQADAKRDFNRKIDKEVERLKKRATAAHDIIYTSGLLQDLIDDPKSNLPNSFAYNLVKNISPKIAGALYDPISDVQVFKSYVKEYFTGLSSYFGNRAPVIGIQKFSDALPNVENTKEANTAILQNKVAIAQVDKKVYEKILQIKNDYNKKTGLEGYPSDIESQIKDFYHEEIEPFLEAQYPLLKKVRYMAEVGKSKNPVYNSANVANTIDTLIEINKDSIVPRALVKNISRSLDEIGKRYNTKEKLNKALDITKAKGQSLGVDIGNFNGYRYALRYNRELKVFETVKEKIIDDKQNKQ